MYANVNLKFHLIFTSKLRKNLFWGNYHNYMIDDESRSAALYLKFMDTLEKFQDWFNCNSDYIQIINFGFDTNKLDHLHILWEWKGTASKFVMKSCVNKIRNSFKKYMVDRLWYITLQESYYIGSVGNTNVKVLENYINKQTV